MAYRGDDRGAAGVGGFLSLGYLIHQSAWNADSANFGKLSEKGL